MEDRQVSESAGDAILAIATEVARDTQVVSGAARNAFPST
jgi:hypothetical protein